MAETKRKRDERINFWLTESEYDDIKSRSEELGMSMSEYIRMLALNADINLDLNKIKVSSFVEVQVALPENSKVVASADKSAFLKSIVLGSNTEGTLEGLIKSFVSYAKR